MAGGSFRIAEGYVEVTADREGYDRTIDRLKSERNVVKVGLSLDDRDFSARLDRLTRERTLGVRLNLDDAALARLKLNDITVRINPSIPDAALRRVQGQLDKLTAERVVRIRADVDTRVGAAEIRNLIQRRTARIGVDVDTRVAAADLANLTRTRTVNVNANARTADARLQLDRLARDRHANIDVGIGGGAGASGGLSVLSSGISKLVAAAVGAAPTLASLGESLIQMGPAAAVAAPAVLALGSAFAAIKIGTSGISDAFKAAFQPAVKGASAALSGAKAVESAQRSLAKAVQAEKDAEVNAAAARAQAARAVGDAEQNLKNTYRDVADANHQAAESLAAAERDLTNAQKQARQAQLDLTQARKDAAMSLEDLNNSLVDSQLSQKQDVLNLADAEKKLAADKAAGLDQSSEQYQKDELARDQAAQALKEQQTQTQRLQDQADAANKAGVEGSQQVVDAKQKIADANQTVSDSEQNLADAQAASAKTQQDGLQQIAKAQRDLADAQAAQVKAATDGARQIADAQQNIADAANAVAEAQQSAALKTGGLSDAMAKLSPNAQAFVNTVIGLRAAWTALKLDVQNALFAGLSTTLASMAHAALPDLRTGLVGTAGVLNTMAKNAAGAVTNLAKTGTLKTLFAGLNDALKPLAKIPGQFITALSQLGVAAQPAFKRITTATAGIADTISQKLATAFKSGGLTSAINNALDIAKQFGKLIGNIAGTIGNVFKAAAAGGGDALGTLGAVFAELRKVTAMPEVQKALASIFTAVNAVAKLVAGTLGSVIQAALPLLAALAPFVTQLANSLGPVLSQLAKALGAALLPIAKQLGPVLSVAGTLLVGLVRAITPLLKPIGDILSAIITALMPVFTQVVGALMQLFTALSGPLTQILASLVPLVGPLLQLFTALSMAMLPLVPQILQLLPPLTQLTLALVNLAVQVLTPLVPLVTGLAAVFAGVLSGALTVLIPVINGLVDALTALVNATSAGVTAIAAAFSSMWTQAKNIFSGLGRDISNLWRNMWTGLRSAWNSFWSGLSSAVSGAWNWVRSSVSSLRSSISGTWSGLWNGVKSTFSSIIGTVQSRIGSFATAAKSIFSGLRDSLGTIWNGVKEKFAAPVRFLISTVYGKGIEKMWNTVASKISSKITLPNVPLGFATGGVVPGQGTKDTVPAMLTPGERVLSLAQVAKLGGHAAIDRMVGVSRNTGPYFGIGGTIGNIAGTIGGKVKGAVTGAVDWGADLVRGGLAKAAAAGIKAIVQPLIDRIPLGAGDFAKLVKAVPTAALGHLLDFLKDDDKKNNAGQIAYSPSAGVAQWAGVINQALGLLGQPTSWLGTVERRMNQESGGNPRAVNLWDSNAKAGYPSTGLMQVIRPTFQTYAGKFRSTGPFMYGVSVDPLANTYAGLNYAEHAYGSLAALNRPGGYDNGGPLPATKHPIPVWNTSGRPEQVLTAQQSGLLNQALERLSTTQPSGGDHFTINVEVTGGFDLRTTGDRKRFAKDVVDEMAMAIRDRDRALHRPGIRKGSY
ncbi:transglycosylase SLT domain-containing protein [Actinacidiphila acidipaludis]|uniref:Transglycosylase SLT domain-containing protein n=1 Tax=Actinacidiphila acidipaludis TaxID=2873382 RepID=A0ABS7Q9A6_9ACTN|nr:transglycosylase SLT domain-containing protein [Streptomyces acidipaludis]MBY8879743.1 transglycosylase SLT domain-containing protein [Streptomyces acidipaludis]